MSTPNLEPDICYQFDHDDNRFLSAHQVRIVYRELTYGARPYFVCPHTGLDATKLFIHNGLISTRAPQKAGNCGPAISRSAFAEIETFRKMIKLDGKERVSKEQARKLQLAMAKHPEQFRNDANVRRYLERLAANEKRQTTNKSWEQRELSTTKALDVGRGIGQYDIFEEVRALTRDDLEALAEPLPELSGPRDDTSRFPNSM